jgi:hypothetical protein
MGVLVSKECLKGKADESLLFSTVPESTLQTLRLLQRSFH